MSACGLEDSYGRPLTEMPLRRAGISARALSGCPSHATASLPARWGGFLVLDLEATRTDPLALGYHFSQLRYDAKIVENPEYHKRARPAYNYSRLKQLGGVWLPLLSYQSLIHI